MTPPTATTANAELVESARENAPEPTHEGAQLLSHAYDGIQEYDNPLPGWWTSVFIGSIVFALFYGLYYHVVDWGPTPAARYEAALGEYESKKELRDRAEAANISEQTIARGAENPQLLAQGEAVFVAKCASCHAQDGSGLIGPNLTDHMQLHGESRMDIYRTITKGIPGTAMLAWSEQLPPTDVLAVTAFVTTLRGKDLPGKAPEGAPVGKFE